MLKWGARKRGETGAWFSTTVNFVLIVSKRKPGDSNGLMGLWTSTCRCASGLLKAWAGTQEKGHTRDLVISCKQGKTNK